MAAFSRPSRFYLRRRTRSLASCLEKAPAYAPGGAKHLLADSHGFPLDALLMYLVMEIHLFWKSFAFSTRNKPINLDQLQRIL
ncbi:hypothetical protein NDU88_006953 [Pleurodeles waltl]|uniref:Uncharacterized protein n=1 Tax=Pleurodeles waltl TaxID=8319 RepID=A0AAV7NTK3_PLEWA|nr:hypothetical protein NDU88_006953 [Pleurodeles waltl]